MPRLLLFLALTAGALSASEDEPSLCSLESLPCPARGQVSLCRRCDGTPDCKVGCRRGSVACGRRGWRCGRGGPCLPFESLCDGQRNCPDGSDEGEALCGHRTALPQRACEKDEFRCGPGADCFPLAFVCDGHPDCEDGWDEAGCVTETSAQATQEGIFTTPKTLETVGLEPLTVAAITALLLLLGAAGITVWLSAKGRPLLARAPPAKASNQLLAEEFS